MNKIQQFFIKLMDQISEQSWFLELKQKWEELSPEHRNYVRLGSILGSILLFISWVIGTEVSLYNLKSEIQGKQEIQSLLQNSQEELRRLRDLNSRSGRNSGDTTQPWSQYLTLIGMNVGLNQTAIQVSAEQPGKKSDLAQESLMEVSFKKVNLKQLIRYSFQLENGARPVKIRNLKIETEADESGYLDAKLFVSAFLIK